MRAFRLGLNAVLLSEQKAAGANIIEVSTTCIILITTDEITARAAAKVEALKRWPQSEGWAGHTVTAEELTESDARKILACFPALKNADQASSGVDDGFEFPEEIDAPPDKES